MLRSLKALLISMLGSLRDLAPIILVIAFFQIVVLQQPVPAPGLAGEGSGPAGEDAAFEGSRPRGCRGRQCHLKGLLQSQTCSPKEVQRPCHSQALPM